MIDEITTWADHYGLWHARVPRSLCMRRDAREAIIAELELREGPHFARESIQVELRSWDTSDTHEWAEYVEIA